MTPMRKLVAIFAVVAVITAAALAAWHFWPTTVIVQSLRQLPEVSSVEYAGPADAPMTLIHLRDWHHLPRELCKLDGIDFEENLAIVVKVQDDQLAMPGS